MSENGDEITWRRSTRCEAGHCVEVAELGNDQIGLRNSQRPYQTLIVSRAAFGSLVTGVRTGELIR